MVFNLDKIEKLIGKIKNEIEGLNGFQKFGSNANKVKKGVLIELIKGGHAGFDAKYTKWEDYLLDSPNGEEGVKDTGDGKKIKKEYELREGSLYNAFAIVMTEWFWNITSNLEKEKKTNWKKHIEKSWKDFEDVRNVNNHGSAKSIFGDFGAEKGGDNGGINVRSWADSKDGGNTAFDYGLTYNQAIKQMKEWGEPKFDLNFAKNILKKTWQEQANQNFLDKTENTNFQNKINELGGINGKWDKNDGINGTIDKIKNEKDSKELTESILEIIGYVFVDWFLEKAKTTTDIKQKKMYLGRIDKFFDENQYYPYQRAINDTTNQENIRKLREEVDSGTTSGDAFQPKLTDIYLEDKSLEGELDLTDEPHLERVWYHHELRIIDNHDLTMARLTKRKPPKGLRLKVASNVEVSKYIPANKVLEELYPDNGTRENITKLDLTQKGLRGTLDLSDFEDLEELVINLDCPWGRKYAKSNYITGFQFSDPKKIKKLTLTNNPNDWVLDRLDNLTNLETLILRGEDYKNPAQWKGSLKGLENLTNLTELDISYCPNIREGLESLESLERLECKETVYEKQLKSFGGDARAWKITLFPEKVSDNDAVISQKIKEYLTESHQYLTELNQWQKTDRDVENKIKILEELNRSS